ncbi:geranylgeranylglyceryl/heptaprenylglyceryl phosphate synthase [Nonlabens marinus]|uniref:Homolog of geranylgeranylglyceryl phosphate synthase n=1 Tax=Nonlabens marinus S1-08 TaxID=1454201 RepID=W8VUL8_9FLAO|nr:geranylgeranylglyceryl/heptaprenylglyceryl phosphate synthase [Nonlabens marinus]BAO54688.1 homolog of geranylgeranylglyceryl phosphate synthase [Nonlabens marinus S1-08]
MTILESLQQCKRTLGILVDPEKLDVEDFSAFAKAMSSTIPQLTKALELNQIIFLLGGSTMTDVNLDYWIDEFRKITELKLVLFPGSHRQVSEHADGLLFLNLISGRNPQYLIGEQVAAASRLRESALQIIPTGYILVDGGVESAVSRVSGTAPLSPQNEELILNTAVAGALMGNQCLYLEAGSGAKVSVSEHLVSRVADLIQIPLIVGGGLYTLKEIKHRFDAGAQMVVVGTAIERNLNWKG